MLPRDIQSESDIVLTLNPRSICVVLELVIVPKVRRRAARIADRFISRDAKFRYPAREDIRTISARYFQYIETDVLSVLNRISARGHPRIADVAIQQERGTDNVIC